MNGGTPQIQLMNQNGLSAAIPLLERAVQLLQGLMPMNGTVTPSAALSLMIEGALSSAGLIVAREFERLNSIRFVVAPGQDHVIRVSTLQSLETQLMDLANRFQVLRMPASFTGARMNLGTLRLLISRIQCVAMLLRQLAG